MHTEQKQFLAAESNSTHGNTPWSFQFYGITSWFILLASNPCSVLHVVVFPPFLQQLKGTVNCGFFSCHLLSAQSVKFPIPQHLSFMKNKREKRLSFEGFLSFSKRSSWTRAFSSLCNGTFTGRVIFALVFGLISQENFNSRVNMMSYSQPKIIIHIQGFGFAIKVPLWVQI